jgi:hypothetical protein
VRSFGESGVRKKVLGVRNTTFGEVVRVVGVRRPFDTSSLSHQPITIHPHNLHINIVSVVSVVIDVIIVSDLSFIISSTNISFNISFISSIFHSFYNREERRRKTV